MIKNKSALSYIWISVIVIISDQLTKCWVLHSLDIERSIHVLPFLNIVLRFNHGAAFSFLSEAGGWQVYLLGAIALIVSVGLLVWLSRLRFSDWVTAVPLCLILGGALGNLIDRIRLGYVVDFIDFHVSGWHFATFNIADSAVSVGAAWLILQLIFSRSNQ